jgi:hypothetical protein
MGRKDRRTDGRTDGWDEHCTKINSIHTHADILLSFSHSLFLSLSLSSPWMCVDRTVLVCWWMSLTLYPCPIHPYMNGHLYVCVLVFLFFPSVLLCHHPILLCLCLLAVHVLFFVLRHVCEDMYFSFLNMKDRCTSIGYISIYPCVLVHAMPCHV